MTRPDFVMLMIERCLGCPFMWIHPFEEDLGPFCEHPHVRGKRMKVGGGDPPPESCPLRGCTLAIGLKEARK